MDPAVKSCLSARQRIREGLTAAVDDLGFAVPRHFASFVGTPLQIVLVISGQERGLSFALQRVVNDRIRDSFEDRPAEMESVEGIGARNIAAEVTRTFEAVALITERKR